MSYGNRELSYGNKPSKQPLSFLAPQDVGYGPFMVRVKLEAINHDWQ